MTPPTAGAITTDADDPYEVDARGLACPMPVIELARAIDDVAIGSRVLLLATDPAAKVDVPVWCRMQRHRLHLHDDQDGVASFLVERLR